MAFPAVRGDMEPASEEAILHWLTLNKFFLRDDYEIRKNVTAFAGREQAWSLFWIEPNGLHRRVEVFNIADGSTYTDVLQRAFESAKNRLATWEEGD